MQIGLKLWSTNQHYIPEVKRLWEEKVFDYLELTAVIGSYDSHAHLWKELNIPTIIHGPTFSQDFSFAHKDLEQANMQKMHEVQKFADLLDAPIMIFHPGIEGDLNECARQINLVADKRIAIENKPYIVTGERICNGYLPEHIAFLKEMCGVQFCFDIGHALCAANSLKLEHIPFVKQFLELKPEVFHIMDGYNKGVLDIHLNLGRGEFPFTQILPLYPKEGIMTIETDKSSKQTLHDFEEDVNFLRGVLSTTHVN